MTEGGAGLFRLSVNPISQGEPAPINVAKLYDTKLMFTVLAAPHPPSIGQRPLLARELQEEGLSVQGAIHDQTDNPIIRTRSDIGGPTGIRHPRTG